MHLSLVLVVAALLQTVRCQNRLNFTSLQVVFAQFPPCSSACAAEQLVAAACPLTSWQDCLCSNETIQYEVTACVLETCSFADQLKSTIINQNQLCVGYNKPSRSIEFVRAAIIIAVITYPIVILRFVTRIFVTRLLWWDDWFILFATVGMIANTVCPTYLAYRGFGLHQWDVNPKEFYLLNLLFWVCQLFYVVIQNAAKFSILFLYIRIFPTPKFRLVTQIFIGFMACHTLSFFVGVIFQCTPIESFWRLDIPGHCVDQTAMMYAGAGLSIFEDFFIMLLPIWVLKDLQMSLKKRVQLCFMFALGSFACVTSMMRLKFIVSYGRSIDGTWDNIPVILWSMIETYTAVICACLMTLRPLLVICFPVIFGSSAQSKNSKNTPDSASKPNTAQNQVAHWANRMRAKRGKGEHMSMPDGDEVYLTNTTGTSGSTMMSRVKQGTFAGSDLEMSQTTRSQTPRSDVDADIESLEPVRREASEREFKRGVSMLRDPSP